MTTRVERYLVEFYPESGAHPKLMDEDLLLRLESTAPFPLPEVGEAVDLLTAQTQGIDHWVVSKRKFLFWETGCTTMFWCTRR